jgi:carbonic anhydrase
MEMVKKGVSLLLVALLFGCASVDGGKTESASTGWSPEKYMTKELQAAMAPDAAVQALKDGNARFKSGNMVKRDLAKQVKATGYGQYPFASVVSCIDSRAAPELVFDQGIGDVFSARIAGNFVNEDILGSLEFASKVAGSKLIVVLGHTSCGAIKGACDDAKLGNLTAMLSRLKPAVQSIPDTGGDRTSKNAAFVEKVAEVNVQQTIANIRTKSAVLREMEDKGQIKIVGAMLNVKTGAVTWY